MKNQPKKFWHQNRSKKILLSLHVQNLTRKSHHFCGNCEGAVCVAMYKIQSKTKREVYKMASLKKRPRAKSARERPVIYENSRYDEAGKTEQLIIGHYLESLHDPTRKMRPKSR